MSEFRGEDIKSFKEKRLTKRRNQKGQISVFLALAFLALFTMFAMTINVGMVVHDKINLQNSVDFASIYVAQRQAEMLNAIAHFNYQIRQAHKLLAYRYVVLGTAGINPSRSVNLTEAPDPFAVKSDYFACFSDKKIMVYPGGSADQWCAPERYIRGIQALTVLPVVNGGVGGNYGLQDITRRLIGEIQNQAARVAGINRVFVLNMLASYRARIAYNKSMIKALATNLTKPIVEGDGGMKDLVGQSVYEGARKTFEYNLSESARRSGNFSITVQNSMSNVDIKQWLPEMATFMVPYYAQMAGGYTDRIGALPFFEEPDAYNSYRATIDTLYSQIDPASGIRDLANGFYPEGHPFEDILGFEKNPWYMVYNQVRGESTSGALFSPRGNVPLVAQAFSKPFGGTIGPWYSKNWPQGSNISSGDKTEEIWPNRRLGNSMPATGRVDATLLPNAPKYPGDRFGYQSNLAQGSTGLLGAGRTFTINEYSLTTYNLFPGGTGQALAWNPEVSLDQNIMYKRELAAIAPDLFDITYYSIESNFHENYLQGKLDNWLVSEAMSFMSQAGYSFTGQVWRDIGFSNQAGQQNFAVKDQIMTGRRSIPDIASTQIFYYLDPTPQGLANMLTRWVNGIDVNDYRGPAATNRFGRCATMFTPSGSRPNIPGECLNNGGRTGYSVKMVSRDYLMSSQHKMGPGSTGAISNPPN